MEFVRVVIEDPRGSTMRHHFDSETESWIERPHPHSSRPWPANYGYVFGTYNPVDDDELDILILSSEPLPTGSRIDARIIGLLERPDGDDKLIGTLVDDPKYSAVTTVPEADIDAINRWFSDWSVPGTWHGNDVAQQRFRQARDLEQGTGKCYHSAACRERRHS